MAYKADKIHERLYQGGLPPGGDGLSKAGIQVLVLCAKEWQDASQYEDIIVICAPGDDDERPHRLARFIDSWKDAAKQVVEHVNAGRTVLVTCMQGLNRSGIVTALALHELTNMHGHEVVQHVQARRQDALCNRTFAKYIVENCQKKESL